MPDDCASHMPTPTEQHTLLQRLAGTFNGEETMHPSPWDPKGGTYTCRVVNRIATSGFNITQDYEQTSGGAVNFSGHGVFSYFPDSDEFTLHWFDVTNLPPNHFRGTLDGAVLTLTDLAAEMKCRFTIDLSGLPDAYAYRMDALHEGEWTPFVDCRLTRAS